MEHVMGIYTEAVKDVGMILLIIAGAGTFKEVLLVSGVSNEIAGYLGSLPIPPLVLGWLMAAIIRVCIGSATIAGLTAAGMILPLVAAGGVNPNLMVLSIGAGSLMFSHVNDTGFWMFKEYFNLSVKETIRSWSLMETIVSIAGLLGVLVLNQIV
jgi:Gnt-I system high-affinity gluconate transporter